MGAVLETYEAPVVGPVPLGDLVARAGLGVAQVVVGGLAAGLVQAAPEVEDVVLDHDVGLLVATAVFREALDRVVAARARGRLEGVVVEVDRPAAALAVLDADAGAHP